MSAPLTHQPFYGGAIKGVIPQGWIDGSSLREVPDHQELFLSPTTLSSQIFEINQRVTEDEAKSVLQRTQPALAAEASDESLDKAAALYHLNDLCDESDKLEVVVAPQVVAMGRFAAGAPSAYRGVAMMTTPKRQRRGPGVDSSVGGATAGSSVDGALATRTSCHYLLVRLKPQETDLLVFVNVPHEEFERAGDPRALATEEELAEEVISGLVKELEVQDWSLFG
ncbi:hypothetical protein BDV59DRAFT_179320 [Aspergillus ambiguus]|uniref:Ran GTPase-binding protein MOG1 n=1 Tax=Aspergillus ambiguus TaxID=176160 RepID=UPI003CCD654D